MRIAVTGASGFIGGAIAGALIADGHEVLAIGRRPARVASTTFVPWDLAHGSAVPGVLAGCEALVHAAAHVAPWGAEAPFTAATVDGTRRLLAGVGAPARVVVIGSASVYDPAGSARPVREEDGPVAPERYLNAYARAKAAQELLVRATRPDALVLRPRIVWGPGDRTVMPRLLARVRGGRLLLPEGGRHPLSTTHVSTLVAAVRAALARPGVHGPLNVADATPTIPRELVVRGLAALGRPVRIVTLPAPLALAVARVAEGLWRATGRGGEPPVTRYAVSAFTAPLVLDLTRLHAELAIRPDVDVAAAVEELAAHPAPAPRPG